MRKKKERLEEMTNKEIARIDKKGKKNNKSLIMHSGMEVNTESQKVYALGKIGKHLSSVVFLSSHSYFLFLFSSLPDFSSCLHLLFFSFLFPFSSIVSSCPPSAFCLHPVSFLRFVLHCPIVSYCPLSTPFSFLFTSPFILHSFCFHFFSPLALFLMSFT